MENPETLATLGTRYTEQRQTKQTGKSIHRHRQQWIQHREQRQTNQSQHIKLRQ